MLQISIGRGLQTKISTKLKIVRKFWDNDTQRLNKEHTDHLKYNLKISDVAYASANDKKEIGIEVIGPTKNVIEKIFEKYNYQASKIDRVYYGGLTKKNIARKESRFLTEEEISILKRQ